jgi:pyrroloquinoline quinone biosynthesis protein B
LEALGADFPPTQTRGTCIERILLTNADLDHTLGLFQLREDRPLAVHASAPVRAALCEDLRLDSVLSFYAGLHWQPVARELTALRLRDGSKSGLLYKAFPVPGKLPRYREAHAVASPEDTIGFRFEDERTGGRLSCIPGLARVDSVVLAELRDCDAILLDGTFWREDELRDVRSGAAKASEMGHLPIGGPDGSLSVVADLSAQRKVYVHINNTNPILRDDSPERREVEAAGASVGFDGLELEV